MTHVIHALFSGRRVRRAVFAAALLIPLSSAAAGQLIHGSLISVEKTAFFDPADIDRIQKPLFEGYAAPQARYPVQTYRIRFASLDYDGSGAEITAMLFVPRYPAPASRPILVFGPGTTGIADDCAPSRERPEERYFGRYRENGLSYAGAGFIAVIPDYLGFDDPGRPQRYFSRPVEGHVMLDAARAVYRFFESTAQTVRPRQKVFAAGYSQGGHAAFAAADLHAWYAPEVPLAGVIGFGATCDVEALLREGPAYAPYIFSSYSVIYGKLDVDPALYLQERLARTLEEDVARMCVDQFQSYYGFDGSKVYRPDFHGALYGRKLAQDFPSLYRRLEENKSGLSGHGLPALLLQGEKDVIVTPATQLSFVKALRLAGSPVKYIEYPGVPHKGTRQAGFSASAEWMERIARGDVPPND
jgi:acetyl esterase/lipase